LAQATANEVERPHLESEIVVTARKRQESILEVPVVVTAIAQSTLERLQVTEMADLPKLVPGLTLGRNLGSLGTLISIRGVGTSALDPGVDQSVSLNIDGLSLSHGLAFSSGMFDVAQVEVLKGPQALFYGKSSPGGVISLRSADPTDETEIMLRAGYEVEGREWRGETVLSGPLAGETLKGRVAAMYAAGKGYFTNRAVAIPGLGGASTKYDRATRPRNYVVRGTLLWEPSERFTARLKASLVRDRGIHNEASQLASCPDGLQNFGIPFIANDDCKLDRELNNVDHDPAAYPGIRNNGVPFLDARQHYGTLELNYDLTPALSLSAVSGYYKLKTLSSLNSTHTTGAGPYIVAETVFKRREVTEEVRLNSDFSGPVNFTLGAFYQNGKVSDRVPLLGNTTIGIPALLDDRTSLMDIETWSMFGQIRWRIVPQLELAGGARWTDETRNVRVVNNPTNTTYLPAVNRLRASNIAPEFTLTYRPTEDLTLFGAYKIGYKSGSFGIGIAPGPAEDKSFGDERVEGGEIGLKTRLADRQVLLNIAAYDYRYKGLQVGAVENSTTIPITKTVNAGSARTYGIDFDVSFRPRAIEGLGLNAAINWNHGRYGRLDNIPCYAGQTVAQGCNRIPDPRPTERDPVTGAQLFTAQDVSGTRLIRSPDWQATFGFDYEFPVGRNLKLTFANSNQFSSRFVTYLAVGRPNDDNYQGKFVKSDLSLSLADQDDRYELALIGKNITDKITSASCSAANLMGGSLLGSPITGGTVSGPAGWSEVGCNTERGRSVWLRATFRP
jgi:iron complex outermembrane receptor protein